MNTTCLTTRCPNPCCLLFYLLSYCLSHYMLSHCTDLLHAACLTMHSFNTLYLIIQCLTTSCPSARYLSHHTLFYSMLPVSLNIDWLTEHLLNTSCLTTYWPTACLPVCFTSYCILPVSLEMPVLLDAVFLLNTFSFASCSLAKRFWSLLHCLSHLMFFSHHHTACLTEPHP